MRKISAIILICLFTIIFGGCFVPEIPLTDAELDAVAQYSSDVLFKHDLNHESNVVEAYLLTPTPTYTPTPTNTPTPTPTMSPAEIKKLTPTLTPTPTLSPTPTPFPDNNEATWVSLAKLIGAPELSVRFAGASEPERTFSIGDSYYALSYVKGYEHLAVKFQIKNDTSAPFIFNPSLKEIKGVLVIDGKEFIGQETTLFENDLQFIGLNSEGVLLKSGEEYNGRNGAVLLFLVPENTEFDSLGLFLTNKDGDNAVIKIQ